MTNTLKISRDLAERLDSPHSSVRNAALESLRRIIAAPVVERQPIAHRIEFTDGHKSKWIDGAPASIDIDDAREGVIAGVELAFASPLAPVAVVLPERREASYYADGNYSAADLAAIWNAAIMATASLNGCLDKVKEMNR